MYVSIIQWGKAATPPPPPPPPPAAATTTATVVTAAAAAAAPPPTTTTTTKKKKQQQLKRKPTAKATTKVAQQIQQSGFFVFIQLPWEKLLQHAHVSANDAPPLLIYAVDCKVLTKKTVKTWEKSDWTQSSTSNKGNIQPNQVAIVSVQCLYMVYLDEVYKNRTGLTLSKGMNIIPSKLR